MTVAAMAYLSGKRTGRLKQNPRPRPRPWDRSVTGTPPRKNDETPGQDGATARDPRGRPERSEATTSAACAPSGPSPRRGRRRATGPTPPVWTAKFTPSPRRLTPDATESASSSSSSPGSGAAAAGGAPAASSRSRATRACRSRNSTPAASSAASAAHARLAHLRWSWLGAARRQRRVAALRRVRETPPPCNEETVTGPSTPSTRLEDVQGRRLRTVDQQTTPQRRSARRRAPPA